MTRDRVRTASAALAAGLLVLLVGCAPEPAADTGIPSTRYDGARLVGDVGVGGSDGVLLDVCLPQDAEPGSPTILSVHGGGWRGGDKAQPQWRDVCEWLASEGYVVFQPNYRLAPDHPFPAALDDLESVIDWIDDDAQVERFGHDPSRLGAFGDSAGGNLVALLATTHDRAATEPIDAVVELSAPLDLTREGIDRGDLDAGFQRVQLDYLGCASYDDCPAARVASPMYEVDSSDPPFFVVAATDDFIPVEQADDFVGFLTAANVDVEYVRVGSDEHALALLDDDLRERIVAWLDEHLDD